jgi:ABC-2 type transport system permease protein
VIRAFMSGLRVDLLQLIRTPFDMVGMLVWPLVFASIAYLLLGHGSGERPLFTASLGAAVMIMWGWVILGAGFALDTQREQGTLELVVGAPTPLVVLISPVMISRAVFGIYGLLLTLVWGRLLFGIPLLIDDWAAFLAAVIGCILAIGTLGLIAASTFVLYRAAFYLGISLQYPVYIACGLILPFSILPGWLRPVSWLLAPTWGFRALREAASGHAPWPAIAMCFGLSLAYSLVAIPCLALFEYLARDRATLKLA